MGKITAVIIAKNEEDMIADCLDSVSFCDEIIVIDNNSADNTADIAKHFKAKVYNVNLRNFSELRNYGLQKTKTEWLLYIDADERVSRELEVCIKNNISNNKSISAYRIRRKNYYLGNNEWPTAENLERLFRKKQLIEWYGELHESAKIKGEVSDINEGYLIHLTHRDLSAMLLKTIQWSEVEANLRFKDNHPPVVWWRFPRVMLTAFYDYFIRQKGYKAGTVGIIESIYQSFSIFITYARLWEIQQKQKSNLP